MTTYFVTGATGFVGSRIVAELLRRDDCEQVYELVREASKAKLERLRGDWPHPEKVVPVVGDLTEPRLGINPADLDRVPDHVVHLAGLHDITASAEAYDTTNVQGSRNAIEFARACGAPTFHHLSSIAVAGDYAGRFREADFDMGQNFPSPYHRSKFDAEALARESGLPYRVYRPSVVVGDSRTGEIDKIDGPYYALTMIALLARLPGWLPLVLPDTGALNVVPVDYVVTSMVALICADCPAGSVFQLSSPNAANSREAYNAFARALNSPRARGTVRFDPARLAGPVNAPRRTILSEILVELGLPPQLFRVMQVPVDVDNSETRRRLAELGLPDPPLLSDYAATLVEYWKRELDPDRHRRIDRRHPLRGKTIVVTGASSGIGRALCIQLAAHGGSVLMIARRAEELDRVREEIRAAGGRAECYPCDVTDPAAVEMTAKSMLSDAGGIDILVNNAGRSMRRSIHLSTDRLHDFERAMSINYFAVVRLTLALLPSMLERQAGQIVNITTAAVDAKPPRWAAYAASKSATDTFSYIIGADLLGDGITVSTVRLPLVRTPMSAPSAGPHKMIRAMSAEHAASHYIIKRAMIRREPVVNALGARFVALNHMYSERISRIGSHLLGFQGMGETAPDGRHRNTRPPLIAVIATTVRLMRRALASRPL